MERRAIAIEGTVQGVGFRPFVYSLATELRLAGFVKNRAGGVWIEVQGEAAALDTFLSRLLGGPPPLAIIDRSSCISVTPCADSGFRIETSDANPGGAIVIAPDTATCAACLAELFDPQDRRYRYPFLNCTNCGPRLTIVTGAPYDRQRTTMAQFEMCAPCRAEYENPLDRRFHAQPTACPACGPALQVHDAHGLPIDAKDPLAFFAAAVREGKIGAMKGLGGYHLVCDARSELAVATLRSRKHRDEKPLAVMVADLGAAKAICDIDAGEAELLQSRRRPIVLLRRRAGTAGDGVAGQVAPGNPLLGVMLPYTPLHHLLLHDLAGVALVMTSGNRSDEPITYTEPRAMERLAGIADLFLIHNRPIHVRCDDSVARIMNGKVSLIRRSRGFAPEPIGLPLPCPAPVLAVGGQMKGTFALGRDHRAIVSHHLGDLDHLEAFKAFESDIDLYEQLFSVRPEAIAHDLHPDYASTRYAGARAAREGVRRIGVQHHHAHMASCMAEHGLAGPVIGVTFDGTGYGTDGTIWGGEVLVGDYSGFLRAAHLRCVGMPGGAQGVREPWRMAAAQLLDAGVSCSAFERRIPATPLRIARAMLDRKLNCPMTSSAGRLFDAVASLAGVRDAARYEGQAAIDLESLSISDASGGFYSLPVVERPDSRENPRMLELDTRPMIRQIAADVNAGIAAATIGRKFHTTLINSACEVCGRIRECMGINTIALSGGVFMNALLCVEMTRRLEEKKFKVWCHARVPCNDGGISFGQLAVAAWQLKLA